MIFYKCYTLNISSSRDAVLLRVVERLDREESAEVTWHKFRGKPDNRIEKRRSSPPEQREADLYRVFRFQSALPIVVMYADGSGVTSSWFSMNDPVDNILHAADSGRMAQPDAGSRARTECTN